MSILKKPRFMTGIFAEPGVLVDDSVGHPLENDMEDDDFEETFIEREVIPRVVLLLAPFALIYAGIRFLMNRINLAYFTRFNETGESRFSFYLWPTLLIAVVILALIGLVWLVMWLTPGSPTQ